MIGHARSLNNYLSWRSPITLRESTARATISDRPIVDDNLNSEVILWEDRQ